MTRPFLLRSLALALTACVTGCGEDPLPGAGTAATVARTAPDDSDAWNLVPAEASALVDLDLAALRKSPWTQKLVTGGFAEDREARLRMFGYDVFDDADRLVVASLDIAGASEQIVVVTGRLDPARVARAFTESTPGATEERWRECRLWEKGTRSVALVGRALVHGTPETVRSAIDVAWGIVPGARGGPVGELARAVDAEGRRPAVTFAVLVNDDLRARAKGIVEVPDELRRVAGRLDLGADVELYAQALLADAPSAKYAARQWAMSLDELRTSPMLRVLGLGRVLDATKIQIQGPRVHARLRIPAAESETLSEGALLLLQALVKARAASAAPAPP